MKITVAIIDDDIDSRLILHNYIKQEYPSMIVTGEADSVASGRDLLLRESPELLLLDISLPDGTAFDLLRTIPEKKFEIIFITAFNTYAIQAFKMAAIDYLLKPVSFDELNIALAKADEHIREKNFAEHWRILLKNTLQQNQYDQKLAIATTEGFIFISLKDIVRLESHSNYTHFYFTNRQKLVSARTMGYYEDLLPADKFCRIHHSHIINISCVEKYNKGGVGGTVVMNDGLALSVSQRKKDDVLRFLKV